MSKEIEIRRVLSEVLNENENLICLSRTRSSESMYITLLNTTKRFLTFRISYHNAFSGFLSVPTFVPNKSEPLEPLIRDYLDKAAWFTVDYAVFFVLAIIKHSRKRKISFLIEDMYSVFSNEKAGMIFYESRNYNNHGKKAQILMGGLDESINKVMRKLYATSIISSYKSRSGELIIYISEAGFRLLDIFSKDYIQRFAKDYENLDWNNLKIPE